MKLVKPSQSLLEGKPYTPSWLMSWKPTLIPKLNGSFGLQGKYRLKVPEGTLSYERCMCGEMLKADCPGEWEPGCDLGNNEKYVEVHHEHERKQGL